MKTIYFNIQSKGGAGKSMLTYLQAIKNEQNEKAFFVDMDGSTLTSSQALSQYQSPGFYTQN
jgi:cellulose biosynthesis protein BcsQ